MARQFRSDDTSIWLEKYGDGSDGAFSPSTSTDAPIDSACTGTSGATSLSATNASFSANQLVLIHQTRGSGAGNWELNKIASYSTGTITTSYPLQNTYVSGAQVIVLKQYSSVTIAGGVTYTAKAWNGTVGGIIAFLCNGTLSIAGTLTSAGGNGSIYTASSGGTAAGGTGGGFRGGLGRATINSATGGDQGEGTAGAGSQSTSANGNGAGGGSAPNTSQDGAGSGGGNGAAGSIGNGGAGLPGTVGASAGNASLTSMVFGGGGGGGAQDSSGGNTGCGGGGAGGGIVFLIGKTVSVTGNISTNGGSGGNISVDKNGGSGAGGSVLFKGLSLTLGSNLVTASGGTGSGGNGGTGRIHADYATSVSGSTTPSIDTRVDTSLNTNSNGLFYSMF